MKTSAQRGAEQWEEVRQRDKIKPETEETQGTANCEKHLIVRGELAPGAFTPILLQETSNANHEILCHSENLPCFSSNHWYPLLLIS